MNVLRRTWRSIRHATKPLRHRVGSLRSQGRIQHTVPILPEDRAYKRRRWHVLVDLIHEHCHDRALTVAEIGIDQGFTSSYLIKYCPQIERIYAVDVRPPRPNSLMWTLDRVTFLHGDSAQSAAQFNDESFHLVFIDGDHTARGVLRDLEAWVPKVRSGGVISGHDYGSHFHLDVKPVVDAFFRDHAHPVHVDANRTFWVLK